MSGQTSISLAMDLLPDEAEAQDEQSKR